MRQPESIKEFLNRDQFRLYQLVWQRFVASQKAAAVFDTLIADYDGIYDLHLFNDRLLLGLKGTMSEAELHLLQLRMTAGRKRQLERGVYRNFLPTGYIRLDDGSVLQDPDDPVRHTLVLLFAKFAQAGSCASLLGYLKKADIWLPRRQVSGHPSTDRVGGMYKVTRNPDGYFLEAHVKLRPVELPE